MIETLKFWMVARDGGRNIGNRYPQGEGPRMTFREEGAALAYAEHLARAQGDRYVILEATKTVYVPQLPVAIDDTVERDDFSSTIRESIQRAASHSCLWRAGKVIHLMAAANIDGIGVIATWELDESWRPRSKATGPHPWKVAAVSSEEVKPVTDFHEGEAVPAEPPHGLLSW